MADKAAWIILGASLLASGWLLPTNFWHWVYLAFLAYVLVYLTYLRWR